MYAFFIHFFDNSIESESFINAIRLELKDIGLDEYHFSKNNPYDDLHWRAKSSMEICNSDVIIFLYSSTKVNNSDRFANVSYELREAFSQKKIVFMVPLENDSDVDQTLSIVYDNVCTFNGIDGHLIKTDKYSLVNYLKQIISLNTTLNDSSQVIDKSVKSIEEEYGKYNSSNRSLLYESAQLNSLIEKKIIDSMINRTSTYDNLLSTQYQSLYSSIENLDERRQTNNSLYTTINTALIALIAASLSLIVNNLGTVIGYSVLASMFLLMPAVGIKICSSWKNTLMRYKELRSAKFKTLDLLENQMPLNLNKAEWEVLKSRNYVTSSEDAKIPDQMIMVYRILIIAGISLVVVSIIQTLISYLDFL